MAAPQAFSVRIMRQDSGKTLESATTIKLGVTRNENQPVDAVVPMTTAQFQGLTNYLALLKNASDTSTVETAITALL